LTVGVVAAKRSLPGTVHVAVPALSVTGFVHTAKTVGVLLGLNVVTEKVTVPGGVPPPGDVADTLALKVTV
jgi:hypothetical protein